MTTQRKDIGLEQFYTKQERVEELTALISSLVNPSEIIEPSAGDGVWFHQGNISIDYAYDLEPKHPAVIKQDFLSLDLPYKEGRLFIGNPPFGRRASLAIKFINKCASTGDYIAFILPASFGKESIMNQVDKSFHLLFQKELFDEEFRTETGTQKVKTIFQIWEKRNYQRPGLVKKTSCADFSFVVDRTKADIAITTHGVSFGKVYENNFSHLSHTTNRFIISRIDKATLVDRLKTLDLKPFARFTTGAPCVSQTELIELYLRNYLTIQR